MAFKYSIVIPAFNEEKTVAKAIRETVAIFGSIKEEYEIIVVDDGSKDATVKVTEELAREYPFLKIIKHEVNRGKGEAVRTGINAATGEYVLFVDADLATHPEEAKAFLPKLGKNKIIIGSRTTSGAVIGSPQPFYRIWGGRFINFLVRKIVGLPYRDTQCGFKMFNREVGQKIFSEMVFSRWLFDVELLARAQADGYEIVEVPVRWNHGATSRVKFGEVLKELPRLSHLRRLLKKAKMGQ
jgi:glycosyltransferase involved in cell wall biosynthesis